MFDVLDNVCKKLERLLNNEVFTQFERFLENSKYSAILLNNLISDLLDLAKFETQTFSFNHEFFDILNVIKQSFQQIKYLAEKKKIKLIQQT